MMTNTVDEINDVIDAFFDIVNRLFANIATNIAPLMVGILPATITWYHIKNELGFDPWIAWAGALVIEFLGFGSAAIWFEFFQHNKKYKDEKNKMMMWTPSMAFGWYLSIMIVFNVMLDAWPESRWIHILSIALFSTLAIPAYALVSAKLLYKSWRAEHRQSVMERKSERSRAKRASLEQDSENDMLSTHIAEQKRVASEYKEQIQDIAEQQWRNTGNYSPTEIARTLQNEHGMTQDAHAATGFISTYLKKLSNNGYE